MLPHGARSTGCVPTLFNRPEGLPRQGIRGLVPEIKNVFLVNKRELQDIFCDVCMRFQPNSGSFQSFDRFLFQ